MNFPVDVIAAGALCGFGLATLLLHYTVTKLFSNVDSALGKIETISKNLAIVTTELEYLKKSSDNIAELQKQVAILMNETFGKKKDATYSARRLQES